jgi:hypothetical protein
MCMPNRTESNLFGKMIDVCINKDKPHYQKKKRESRIL